MGDTAVRPGDGFKQPFRGKSAWTPLLRRGSMGSRLWQHRPLLPLQPLIAPQQLSAQHRRTGCLGVAGGAAVAPGGITWAWGGEQRHPSPLTDMGCQLEPHQLHCAAATSRHPQSHLQGSASGCRLLLGLEWHLDTRSRRGEGSPPITCSCSLPLCQPAVKGTGTGLVLPLAVIYCNHIMISKLIRS